MGMKWWDLEAIPLLCLTNVSRYFIYFVFGHLCRKHQKRFLQLMENESAKALFVVSFVFLFIAYWQSWFACVSLFNLFNNEFLIRFVGVAVVLVVFLNYKDFFESNNPLAKGMRFIGTRTLDIYLLHFFFLPNWQNLFPEFNDYTLGNPALTSLVVVLMALVIVYMCLLTSYVLRSSHFLGHWLFGAKH